MSAPRSPTLLAMPATALRASLPTSKVDALVRPCGSVCLFSQEGHGEYFEYFLIFADIDECQVDNGGCDRNVKCVNRIGAKNICGPCPEGYWGSGTKINEFVVLIL